MPEASAARLRSAVARGLDARDRLIGHGAGIVVAIASRMDFGLPFEDRVSEGFVGLARAADIFEPRGLRFSTLAGRMVRQAISRAQWEQGGPVRRPGHLLAKARAASAARARIEQEMGRRAEDAEVALDAGVEAEWLPAAEGRRAVRMDAARQCGDGEGREEEPWAMEAWRAQQMPESGADIGQIARAVAGLPPEERGVVEAYFGLRGEAAPQREIAERIGVSRARVGQILGRAIRRLRRRMRVGAG